jgi:phytoene synthase
MNGVVNDSFRALMAFEVDRARSLFDSSEKLFPLIHSDARSCPTLLHATYRGLLDRIEASGYDVFERRISLSKVKKLSLAAKLWAATYLPSLPPPLNRK